jgi:hypothetical protein
VIVVEVTNSLLGFDSFANNETLPPGALFVFFRRSFLDLACIRCRVALRYSLYHEVLLVPAVTVEAALSADDI